jgi:hypothetical protein
MELVAERGDLEAFHDGKRKGAAAAVVPGSRV